MDAAPGATGAVTLRVGADDTAVALGSGTVEVLATPRVIALCEEATCVAVAPLLGEGETTVGTEVQLKHVAAVAVGGTVTADATLERVEGRRLTFTVSVSDDAGLVAAGKVTRVVVDGAAFMAKARSNS